MDWIELDRVGTDGALAISKQDVSAQIHSHSNSDVCPYVQRSWALHFHVLK
jgi:hypothetical protein